MLPQYELTEVLQQYGTAFREHYRPLGRHQQVLRAIERCRTADYGGHIDRCDDCGHDRISYNSCRNRHCPKCQTTNRERWILQRMSDLLPCTYFHIVFTIPEELNTYCLKYPVQMYDLLFHTSRDTMQTFGRDTQHLGADVGMISILHTWGQTLTLHPHVHMIVPGGGITKAGNWKAAHCEGRYLFPAKALRKVFRGKFMEGWLKLMVQKQLPVDTKLKDILYRKDWNVDARQPFLGPKQVVEYLGRYTHKIAISNHRLKRIADGQITFSYKDYRNAGTKKEMTLSSGEFLRRFCLHILPRGYMKIRHYGILASRMKPRLKALQVKLGMVKTSKEPADYKHITLTRMGFDIDQCPCCKNGRMVRILSFSANAPPIPPQTLSTY